MKIEKRSVKKILFITLSNLGDIVLSTPVFSKLIEEFPDARIDIITGNPGKEIFFDHSNVLDIMIHDEKKKLSMRISLALKLRKNNYDMVIDLKNSVLPYVLGARYKTGLFMPSKGKYFKKNKLSLHKVNVHRYKLVEVGLDPFNGCSFFVPFSSAEGKEAAVLLDTDNKNRKKVMINPGAKSHLKRWPASNFAELSDRLVDELNCEIFIAGNKDDIETVNNVKTRIHVPANYLSGRTSLGVLAASMRMVDLVITNDSAPLHLASAMNSPTVAIFGPTDEEKYGPLSVKSKIIKTERSCRPCEKALCSVGSDEGCIGEIPVDAVFEAAKELLV